MGAVGDGEEGAVGGGVQVEGGGGPGGVGVYEPIIFGHFVPARMARYSIGKAGLAVGLGLTDRLVGLDDRVAVVDVEGILTDVVVGLAGRGRRVIFAK